MKFHYLNWNNDCKKQSTSEHTNNPVKMERKSEKKKKNHDTISSALESAMQEVLKTKGLEKVSLKKDEKKAIKEEAKEILKQRELDLEKKERQNMKNQPGVIMMKFCMIKFLTLQNHKKTIFLFRL